MLSAGMFLFVYVCCYHCQHTFFVLVAKNRKGGNPTKKIVILTCLKSVNYCTGAACLKAFYNRSGAFRQYQEEILELVAFCHCNGCDSILEQDNGMQEKLERILKINPDAVHLGVCTLHKDTGQRCQTIQMFIKIFQDNDIAVIDGTHGSLRLLNIGMPITI
mgnify:CR=1 FL=1